MTPIKSFPVTRAEILDNIQNALTPMKTQPKKQKPGFQTKRRRQYEERQRNLLQKEECQKEALLDESFLDELLVAGHPESKRQRQEAFLDMESRGYIQMVGSETEDLIRDPWEEELDAEYAQSVQTFEPSLSPLAQTVKQSVQVATHIVETIAPPASIAQPKSIAERPVSVRPLNSARRVRPPRIEKPLAQYTPPKDLALIDWVFIALFFTGLILIIL